MTKAELIGAVQKKIDIKVSKKDLGIIVQGLFDVVQDTLADGDKISIVGFGTFDVKSRGERQGKNPKTGEPLVIPASKTPHFKAGKNFKERVNR